MRKKTEIVHLHIVLDHFGKEQSIKARSETDEIIWNGQKAI